MSVSKKIFYIITSGCSLRALPELGSHFFHQAGALSVHVDHVLQVRSWHCKMTFERDLFKSRSD